MVLATADEDGRPSSRTVLCKGLDERGVVFYTNYTSAKSHDLRVTRYASATFPWYAQHRQVHVRGPVEEVAPEETQEYWASRPRGSQLGAWASAQSTVVRDRRVLDDALAAITQRFADDEPVPVPGHWGGWRIQPEQVEFWQGRADRMHDRLRFDARPRSTARWAVSPPRALMRNHQASPPHAVVSVGNVTRPAIPTTRLRRFTAAWPAARSPTPARCARPPTGGCGRPASSP